MRLSPGTRLGPYEVIGPLGAGGMGEVYKARDTRLGRTVALKVLPSDFAGDPDRRARFEREARAIASLSHPHVCVVHDVSHEASPDGTAPVDYLVMEHLDGETLAARLARAEGPLPLPDALDVAGDIAEALDAAHRAGIVHRDLKPANIMLTKAGAKLLDFGVAKWRTTPAVALERSTTVASDTARGTLLGTVHYMAPEQVEGHEADARSDIWAFGVVLYEMAAGAKPFAGESPASVIGAILKDSPPTLSVRQPLCPVALDRIVVRCLQKDPDARWQSAADLRATLALVGDCGRAADVEEAPARARSRRLYAVAVVAGGALLLAAGVFLDRRLLTEVPPSLPLVEFDVLPPSDVLLSPAPVAGTPQLALSPDGRQLAFVGMRRRGASQIYVRPLDDREARPLATTEGASFPFWAPDSQTIGFFAGGTLKKIALAGGTSQVLTHAPAGRGGAWGADGSIVFAPTPNGQLFRVSAAGGPTSPVTELNRALAHNQGDAQLIGHNWPHFLPGGRSFLFYQRAGDRTYQGIERSDLSQLSASTRVMASDGLAVYVAGHLAFVQDGMLMVQAVDERTLQASGEPVRIADRVGYFRGSFGYSSITASPEGLLAFGPPISTLTRLRWLGRNGTGAGELGNAAAYVSPRLSPDGRAVAVAITGETMADRDIWTLDVARNTASRVTSDPDADWFPAWSQDGRLYFGSTRTGITAMFQKSGVDSEQMVDTGSALNATYPSDVSTDDRLLAWVQSTTNGYDVGVASIGASVSSAPFLDTTFNEVQPRFAPNQKWIAYTSDESGRFEVYVRPYPASNAQWRVSTAGGMQPEWRRDGKELFYIAADGKMMAVPVSPEGATFEAGAPQALFEVETPEAIAPYPTHYAVTADGQRFLVNTVVDQPARPAITVMLNWASALRR